MFQISEERLFERSAAANETTPIERSQVDPVQSADPTTGSLVVKVAFTDQRLSPIGIWVRMRPEPWTRGERRFGTRVNAQGRVRFDGIPSGKWLVEAETSGVDIKETLQIEAGQEHEQQLTIDCAIPIQVVSSTKRADRSRTPRSGSAWRTTGASGRWRSRPEWPRHRRQRPRNRRRRSRVADRRTQARLRRIDRG